jgi:hypothetical protein
MLWIYHAMCKTVHEPIISAIELTIDMDNRIGKLSVPGVLETAVESRESRSPERVDRSPFKALRRL